MNKFLKIHIILSEKYYRSISFSIFKTQFGQCLVASTNIGICNVLFADSKSDLITDLESRWKKAKVTQYNEPSHVLVQEYIAGDFSSKKIHIHLNGTDFQIHVWKELLTIPIGKTKSYGDIATSLKVPCASRAVGTAIGNNPIGYLIPCHRVINTSGKLGGYRWGIERKQKMLDYETMQK